MRIWGLSNQAMLLLATRAVNIINQSCCGSRLIAESCLITGAGTFFSPLLSPAQWKTHTVQLGFNNTGMCVVILKCQSKPASRRFSFFWQIFLYRGQEVPSLTRTFETHENCRFLTLSLLIDSLKTLSPSSGEKASCSCALVNDSWMQAGCRAFPLAPMIQYRQMFFPFRNVTQMA